MSWPLVKLGEVAPSKALKKPVVRDEDNVWQLNLDMVESGSGKVLNKIKAPLSEAGSSTHWFDSRHVLYSKLRPYLNKVVLPDEQGLATTELVPMLPDPKMLDRRYLVHYLRSKQFVSWISDQVAGAKMPRVSMKVFWDHEIPLPPLDEQKRIAAILDKANAIRQKRKQAIELADEFLRSVFLDMFGDPVANPKEWEVKTINDFCNVSSGSTPSRKRDEYFQGTIPWVKTTEVDGYVINETEESISEIAIKETSCKLNPKGSIVLAMYGQGKTRGKVGILGIEAATNQACAVLAPSNSINMAYLYYYLKLSYEMLRSLGQGGGQPNLNGTIVKQFLVLNPPRDLQDKFVNIVQKIESGVDKNKAMNIYAENLFNSLSKKAFSGQL